MPRGRTDTGTRDRQDWHDKLQRLKTTPEMPKKQEQPTNSKKHLNQAAKEADEWKTPVGKCMICGKPVFGNFYGYHDGGKKGTCSNPCERIADAQPKQYDYGGGISRGIPNQQNDSACD